MVKVYFIHLHDQLPLNELLPYFPTDFIQKIQRFRYRKDALASLYGRLLLRHGYQQLTGNTLAFEAIQYGKVGKPFLTNSPVQFNISHSHQMVVCAIADTFPIGIDIEYRKPIDIADFKFQMTECEWTAIHTANDQLAAFYQYWTKKEAVMKATGKGFTLPLQSFEVLPTASTTLLGDTKWHFQSVAIHSDYTCYLTTHRSDLSPYSCHQLVESDFQALFLA